jgi:hypothetical protein
MLTSNSTRRACRCLGRASAGLSRNERALQAKANGKRSRTNTQAMATCSTISGSASAQTPAAAPAKRPSAPPCGGLGVLEVEARSFARQHPSRLQEMRAVAR